MRTVLKFIIYLYRITLAPILNRFSSCRYEPSCSHFMEDAVEEYGFMKGFTMGIRRVLSCHPFSNRPIYDPVEKKEEK